jgi:hypothetical protein
MRIAVVLVACAAACSQGSATTTRAPAAAVEVAAPVAAPVAPERACAPLPDDRPETSVSLDGTLYVDETFAHPNGTRTRPYILRLDAPRCVAGADGVREVHVGGIEGVELRPWVGRRVRVSGVAIQAMTAWHARPVVILASAARPTG